MSTQQPEPGPAPSSPSVGRAVLHLFWKLDGGALGEAITEAITRAEDAGAQVVCAAMLGHKADLGVMAIADDQWVLRRLQTGLAAAGCTLVDSYVSLTELSEYSQGVPEEMQRARLDPKLPPDGKPVFCFYPMSKKRSGDANWFTLPYDERRSLMYEHGASGRTFAGRVTQVVTGSTGLDDFEWGVTLFCVHPDDVKDVVYTMRFDTASALYGEFGDFKVGMVAPIDRILHEIQG